MPALTAYACPNCLRPKEFAMSPKPLIVSFALLALAAPAFAQTPPVVPAPTTTTTTTNVGPPPALLNTLVHSPQILGVTKTDGTRYLERIISGDNGFYVAQTFHFAGPPQVTNQTIRYGRNGRQHRTIKYRTDTTIPDDRAVTLLLKGVAGGNVKPREIAGPRDMFQAKDIKFLQALTPPTKLAKAAASPFQSSGTTPTAKPKVSWTMSMLWPTPDGSTPTIRRRGHGRRKNTL